MQETNNKVLSIRLAADGFYFNDAFVACPPERLAGMLKGQFADAGYQRAYVEIDTLSTVAVPDSGFENALAEGYLSVNNLLPEGYVPVRTQWNETVIVMSCREEIVAWLRECYGTEVEFFSPLACVLDTDDKTETFNLCLTDTNVYIALWNKELKFAQVLPYSSPADLGYYISTLAEEYGLNKEKVYLVGKHNKKLIRQLERFFPRIFDADNKRKT